MIYLTPDIFEAGHFRDWTFSAPILLILKNFMKIRSLETVG
jgi:hypothetical protein